MAPGEHDQIVPARAAQRFGSTPPRSTRPSPWSASCRRAASPSSSSNMRAIMAVARHIEVLDHGQKIAEGTPKEIVENPEVIRAYLGFYVHPPTPGES